MAKNTAVTDTYTGTVYTSISYAARETGAVERDIKSSCERFHENKKIIPRWIYFSDTTDEIMEDFTEQ